MTGLARLLAIAPDAPAALLKGSDSNQQVRPINTDIKAVDRMGIMEILWYTGQLKCIAKGGEPRPNESGFWVLLKAAFGSGWGHSAISVCGPSPDNGISSESRDAAPRLVGHFIATLALTLYSGHPMSRL